MVLKVTDLEVSKVKVNDPFMVECAGANWKPNPLRYKNEPVVHVRTPLDLPTDKLRCCHVAVVEVNSEPTYHTCSNQVWMGRHGFLCKYHANGDIAQGLQKQTQQRLGYFRNEEPAEAILVRMDREVASADPLFSYKKYAMWRWCYRIPEGNWDAEDFYDE